MGLVGVVGSLIGGLTSLGSAVETIESVVSAPEARRELAGSRLHEAIDEIAASFQVIEAQLVSLLVVDVQDPACRGTLVALEGGGAALQLARMRGHCSSIARIWEDDLSSRFQKLFTDAATRDRLASAFGQLGTLDGVLLRAAQILGDGLAVEAAAILDHIDGRQPDLARDRLIHIRAEVRDLRRIVNRTLASMTELKFVLRRGGAAT